MRIPNSNIWNVEQIAHLIHDIVDTLRLIDPPLSMVKFELYAARDAAKRAMVLAGNWNPVTEHTTMSLVRDMIELYKLDIDNEKITIECSTVDEDYVRICSGDLLVLLHIDICANHNGERFVDKSSVKLVGRYLL